MTTLLLEPFLGGLILVLHELPQPWAAASASAMDRWFRSSNILALLRWISSGHLGGLNAYLIFWWITTPVSAWYSQEGKEPAPMGTGQA